jgi:predicted transposase YbfD/YdcC
LTYLFLTQVGQIFALSGFWAGLSPRQQFYLSSLPVDAQLNGRVIRQHWGIENQVHWTLDVTFNEDQCRIRSLNSPQTWLF